MWAWSRRLYDRIFNRRRLLLINESGSDVKIYICRRDEEEGLPKVRVEDGSQKLSGNLTVSQAAGGGVANESAFHVEYEPAKSRYSVPFHVLYLKGRGGNEEPSSRKCWIDKGIACRVIISRGKDEDACTIGFNAGEERKIIIRDSFFTNSPELGRSCMPNIPNSTRERVVYPVPRIGADGVAGSSNSADDRSSMSSAQQPSTDTEETKSDPSITSPIDTKKPREPLLKSASVKDNSLRALASGAAQAAVGMGGVSCDVHLRTGDSDATVAYDEERGLKSRTSSAGELALIESMADTVSQVCKSNADVNVNLCVNETSKTFSVTSSRSTSTPALSIQSALSPETRPISRLSCATPSTGAVSPHDPIGQPIPLTRDKYPSSLNLMLPPRTLSWSSILASPASPPTTYRPHEGSFARHAQGKSTPVVSRPEPATPLPRHAGHHRSPSFDSVSPKSDEEVGTGFTPVAPYMKTQRDKTPRKLKF